MVDFEEGSRRVRGRKLDEVAAVFVENEQ